MPDDTNTNPTPTTTTDISTSTNAPVNSPGSTVTVTTPDGTTTQTDVAAYKERRPVTLLAAFGILAIAGAAVGGLIYDLTVNGNPQSLTQLGTLATLGLGGLLALSGNKNKGE